MGWPRAWVLYVSTLYVCVHAGQAERDFSILLQEKQGEIDSSESRELRLLLDEERDDMLLDIYLDKQEEGTGFPAGGLSWSTRMDPDQEPSMQKSLVGGNLKRKGWNLEASWNNQSDDLEKRMLQYSNKSWRFVGGNYRKKQTGTLPSGPADFAKDRDIGNQNFSSLLHAYSRRSWNGVFLQAETPHGSPFLAVSFNRGVLDSTRWQDRVLQGGFSRILDKHSELVFSFRSHLVKTRPVKRNFAVLTAAFTNKNVELGFHVDPLHKGFQVSGILQEESDHFRSKLWGRMADSKYFDPGLRWSTRNRDTLDGGLLLRGRRGTDLRWIQTLRAGRWLFEQKAALDTRGREVLRARPSWKVQLQSGQSRSWSRLTIPEFHRSATRFRLETGSRLDFERWSLGVKAEAGSANTSDKQWLPLTLRVKRKDKRENFQELQLRLRRADFRDRSVDVVQKSGLASQTPVGKARLWAGLGFTAKFGEGIHSPLLRLSCALDF